MANLLEWAEEADSTHETDTFFADVIVPLPLPNLYTYRIPKVLNQVLQMGMRIVVPFGKSKVLTGVVRRIHQQPPKSYQAKYVLEVLDEAPSLTEQQLALLEWMADYYLCTIGEVLNVAMPSGLKISSESKMQLNPNGLHSEVPLSDKEQLLVEALQAQDSLSYQEAAELLGMHNIYKIIKSLVQKEVLLLYDEVKEKYQPKVVRKVRLARAYVLAENIETLLENLAKKPKQGDVVLFYLNQVPVLQDWTLNEGGLPKSTLTKAPALSNSALKTLISQGVFEEFEVIVSRFEDDIVLPEKEVSLSPQQAEAIEAIFHSFAQQPITLLHGITGSGKTEVYIRLIQEALAGGSQVLYLLPEIALTTQIVSRLRKFFGSAMGIYHSKFSDNERVEVWQGVLSGRYEFVVGVRSAIFLPFRNLGLIIVDEEHENSYKQTDPAPRYHARDMATVMAHLQHCKVLLGSATPSFESYYHAQTGKYGLVQLKERFGQAELPEINLNDLRDERKAKTMHNHFSSTLLEAIQARLDKQEQVILFQNRRGYAPYLSCQICAWIPKCKHCSVSLTYHLYNQELRCHYCGYVEHPPQQCPACGSTQVETVGMGTEKIEDELKIIFPHNQINRMDLDTTREKNSYQQLIQDFENRQIDILVGTQMISKGLDFDNVSLVGIFDIDRMLNYPDFRSIEKTFQLLTQVSGRAGRKDKKGEVIIQTVHPDKVVLQKVIEHDYEGLYESEIAERQSFLYPPFTRLIKLIVKHPEKPQSLRLAQTLATQLRQQIAPKMILGPEAPVIYKIRNLYHYHLLIKIDRNAKQLKALKQFIGQTVDKERSSKTWGKCKIVIDVDPL